MENNRVEHCESSQPCPEPPDAEETQDADPEPDEACQSPDGEVSPEEPELTEGDGDEVPPEASSEGQSPKDTAAEAEEEPESGQPPKELPPETLAFCRAAIEAMLFTMHEPVSSRRLAEALKDTGIDGRGVRRIVSELAKEYDAAKRGFAIEELAGGFQLLTRPEYAEYVDNILGGAGSAKLSQAALETLAVVAYKQPVTRADIEAIRGVQAGPLLRSLLQKNLVKITGRAEILGRPLLYGTTKKFLEHFGLKSLNELPKVEELPRP